MEKNQEKSFEYNEVLESALAYFNGDDLAAKVWVNKYARKDSFGNLFEKSPDDMHKRLAKELARIENKYPNPLSEDEIYDSLKDFKRIVPQGGPMSGIGNNNQVTSLANCFVVGNSHDSYGSIFTVDQEQAQLMKRRGGVGHDLSHIRPDSTPVKNDALTSTGVVPFMERYSNTTKEVAQSGRRGALMLSISVKHPDAENFIDAKLTQGKVTNANVSVKLTDEFLNCALNNEDYIQSYPIDINYNNETEIDFANLKYDTLVKGSLGYYKKINANRIWKKIIHNAWKSAEPGILFWDTLTRESIPSLYGENWKERSTNPCFPSSEYLLTDNGYYKFGDLLNKKTNNVICDKRISYVDDGDEKPDNWKIDVNNYGTVIRKASNVFLTQKDAEIIEIKTSKGFKLRCTPDHHIATTVGMIEAKDLTENHNILIAIPENEGSIINRLPDSDLEKLALLWGLVQGDGSSEKRRRRVYIDFWGDDADRMKNYVINLIDSLYVSLGERKNKNKRILTNYFVSENKSKIRIGSAWLGRIFEEYGFDFNNKFIVPEFILNNSNSNIGKYYIASLMYCDGSIQGSRKTGYTIRLSQSNENFLNKIQMILHSNGMIFGIYERRDEKITKLPNGKGGYSDYKTKKQFDLISLGGSIVKYMESIGFLGDINKENKFDKTHNYQIIKSFTDKITEKNNLVNEPVYCLKEDIGRNIIVNGISARRCGEIPLPPYDSCRLLALNLYGYVVNPFSDKSYFNFDFFRKDVYKAQRYMDDIIDLELEKIDKILNKIETDPESEEIKLVEKNLWIKIKAMAEIGRRTGLGITAEGDMLAALGYKYGTDEANKFSEEIHKTLKLMAYRSSVYMAKERGAFPIYNAEVENNSPFISRIKEEDADLYTLMQQYGRRNIALLTIAPTGTVSLMTQTTSGIEPAFLPVYFRRRKLSTQEKNIKPDFIDDEGVAWAEYPVFHHKFEIWLEINGYDIDVVKSMNKKQLDEIVKLSPYYGATSNDVDWVKKVEMQGRIQKHVDHSISVTVNLPNNVDEEIVSKVYETGWRSGCKGITVYRDGSRDGVLITKSQKEEKKLEEIFEDTHAPKRPKRLKGHIIRFQNNLEKWVGVVGLMNDRPYEIFTGKLENGLSNLSPSIKECEIVKNIIEIDGVDENGNTIKIKKKRYDIEYIDSDGNKQIHTGLNHAFNPEYWNYAKLISGILRHRMPLIYVVELIESLNLDSEHLNTWKNGVIRVIKRFIKDGVKVSGKTCPKCGGEHLEYKEGCVTCMSCGYGKCG